MDKRKVIQAYRKGFLSMQECAQILGLDVVQTRGLLLAMEGACEKKIQQV